MGDSITGLPLKMVGEDGNAFAILGKAHQVLRQNGMADKISEFDKEAMSGNYDHLLATCTKWFEVE